MRDLEELLKSLRVFLEAHVRPGVPLRAVCIAVLLDAGAERDGRADMAWEVGLALPALDLKHERAVREHLAAQLVLDDDKGIVH